MRNVSKQYLDTMKERRNFYVIAEITFVNGETKPLGKDDFSISGNSIFESAESSSFPLGILAAKRITISLINDDGRWFSYAFYGAKISLQTKFDLDDETTETLNIGTFTVITPENYDTTISITAMDDSYKTDIDYSTKLLYPMSAGEALRDSCKTCGVDLLTTAFQNDGYIIQTMPENLTHRQFIGMIAMIAGGNAVFDENSRLVIKPYDFTAFEKSGDEWGGIFDNLAEERYMTGDDVSGGVFEPWDVGEVEDPLFSDLDSIHFLHDFASGITVESDDVVITGVQLRGADEEGNETIHLYGEKGYILSLENQLAVGKEDEVAELIGKSIVGLRFRPFSGNHISYPMAEFMDLAYLVDRVGGAYRTVLTDVTFNYYGFTSLKCSADSPIRNSSTYYGNETKAIVQARKEAGKQLSAYELAVQQMNSLSANTMGFFSSTEKLEDGSIIAYRHDKPTREESTVIYKSGIDGFFVSRDGGKSYQNGFDAQGNAILNVLSVIGINFDWARGGTLTLGGYNNKYGRLSVLDKNGQENLSIDHFGAFYNGGAFRSYESNDDPMYFGKYAEILSGNLQIGEEYKRENGAIASALRNSIHYLKTGNSRFPDNEYIFYNAFYPNSILFWAQTFVQNGWDYMINNGIDPDGYTERNIFNTSARFNDETRFSAGLTFSGKSGYDENQVSMSLYKSSVVDPYLYIVGNIQIRGSVTCNGNKQRTVETKYGNIGMNSFETPTPYFADIGSGEISDDGEVTIFFDPIFSETIDLQCEYQVFITKTSQKQVEWIEKNREFFIVHGEPKATFDWMLCVPQRDYSAIRMDAVDFDTQKEVQFDDSIFCGDDAAMNILNSDMQNYEKELELL